MALFGNITLPNHPCPENVRMLDLLPIPAIRRMQRIGVAIDKEWLGDLGQRLEARKQDLQKEITSYIPVEALDDFVSDDSAGIAINVDSAEQIAELLFEKLRVGIDKPLKRTKSGTRLSTGKKQLETLKRDHPVIPKILQYRECSKLKNTYCDSLPELARWDSATEIWRVHSEFPTTRTDTGRLASRHPNLQNIPTRTALGAEVRKGFVAAKGKLLASRDFAQIELRWMAERAQEPGMMRIFKEGGDIHLDTAMRAFDIDDPKKVDKILHRAPCKNVNFGVAYGLGETGLYDLMALTYATAGQDIPDWLTVEWCSKFIEKWFELYPKMRDYFELQHYRARRYGITWCCFGGVRLIPEVHSCHERVRAAGLRQAGNNPIQRGAAGIFKIGLARAEERVLRPARAAGIYAEALLPIHDEVLMEVDEEWAKEVGDMAGREMARALEDEETGESWSRVPILTDGREGERWQKE